MSQKANYENDLDKRVYIFIRYHDDKNMSYVPNPVSIHGKTAIRRVSLSTYNMFRRSCIARKGNGFKKEVQLIKLKNL